MRMRGHVDPCVRLVDGFDVDVHIGSQDLSFGAIGRVSPTPLAEMMLGLTPCDTRKETTVAARRVDNTRLSGMPWRCSAGPTWRLSVYP